MKYRPCTTGNPMFAECWRLCRVQDIEHSAKIQFDECLPKATRQKFNTRQRLALPSATRAALGTQPHVCAANSRRARYPSRPLLFAECPQGDTRQTPLCRVPRIGHSAKTITCAARDRTPLPRTVHLCEDRYRYSLPSARLRHSAKIC